MFLGAICALAFSVSVAFGAVDLNTASKAELEAIKGIGAKKAEAIIEYRKAHPFKNVDELKNVKGFGEKSVNALKNELSVGGAKGTNPANKNTKK